MTERDRLLAVFDRRPLDRLPWVPDLTYWAEAQERRGCLPSAYRGAEGRRRLHADVGACVYYEYSGNTAPLLGHSDGVTVTSETHGDRVLDRITCDGHVLERTRQWLPESYCYALCSYFVTEARQLGLVREIVSRRRYTPNPDAARAVAAVGDVGVPITAAPRSPLPALLADWAGVEATVFLLADAAAEVEATLTAIDRANDGFFTQLRPGQARLLHFCDNLTATVIGGYWDGLCAEYYRRRVAQVHAVGQVCVTHLDGTTRGLIPRLMVAGLDGIESLTPAPVGDQTLAEMAALLAPHDGVLWGGLPGAMFAPPWGWDDLRAMLDELHRLYRAGRRVIVASADQVPPDATLDAVRRVGEYVATLGPR